MEWWTPGMWRESFMGTEAPPCVPMSLLSSCIASILRRHVWRLANSLISTRSAASELRSLQQLTLVWNANAGGPH